MKKFIWITALLPLLFVSCDKTEENLPCETLVQEHLIFGTYYGECIGNCALLFKINNCQVFADDMDYYYNSELEFQSDPLSLSQYEIAEEAALAFPEALWNETDSVFGIPDAYDQGGIYIEKSLNGDIRSWNIDTNEEVLPIYLAEYVALIKMKVEELNQ